MELVRLLVERGDAAEWKSQTAVQAERALPNRRPHGRRASRVQSVSNQAVQLGVGSYTDVTVMNTNLGSVDARKSNNQVEHYSANIVDFIQRKLLTVNLNVNCQFKC